MLISKKEVIKILQCPQTGEKIEELAPDFLQSRGNNNNFKYPIINGYPIVIDFNQSILAADKYLSNEANSPIERKKYNYIEQKIKQIISPPQKRTAENVIKIREILREKIKPKVLIIGGGSIGQGMQPLYEDPELELIAFDIYISDNVQFVADAHQIPLPDNYFDCVIIQAVLEHVLEPQQVVKEIYRVLKKGGIVYAETPFLAQVHEGAYDFTRFTESGHRYLFKQFELINSGVTAGAGTQLLWTIDFFSRSLFRSEKVGKLFKLLFFWLRYVDQIIPEKYAVDSASGVFFLGIKTEKILLPSEIIKHYQGAQL